MICCKHPVERSPPPNRGFLDRLIVFDFWPTSLIRSDTSDNGNPGKNRTRREDNTFMKRYCGGRIPRLAARNSIRSRIIHDTIATTLISIVMFMMAVFSDVYTENERETRNLSFVRHIPCSVSMTNISFILL